MLCVVLFMQAAAVNKAAYAALPGPQLQFPAIDRYCAESNPQSALPAAASNVAVCRGPARDTCRDGFCRTGPCQHNTSLHAPTDSNALSMQLFWDSPESI